MISTQHSNALGKQPLWDFLALVGRLGTRFGLLNFLLDYFLLRWCGPAPFDLNFGFTFASLWVHVGFTSMSLWVHVEPTWISLWVHFKLALIQLWIHFELTRISLRSRIGFTLIACRLRFHVDVTSMPLWFHAGSTSNSRRVQFGFASAKRVHFKFTSNSLWVHFDSQTISHWNCFEFISISLRDQLHSILNLCRSYLNLALIFNYLCKPPQVTHTQCDSLAPKCYQKSYYRNWAQSILQSRQCDCGESYHLKRVPIQWNPLKEHITPAKSGIWSDTKLNYLGAHPSCLFRNNLRRWLAEQSFCKLRKVK